MTVSMDDAVGKVLASLQAHDLEKNTLIIFISDNGGFRAIASRNTPLRAPSGTSSRAAIASPSRCNGPDAFLPARSTRSRSVPWISYPPPSWPQAAPSIPLEARRRQPHALLNGTDKGHPHETLYWRIGERQAIRHGNWKMIHDRA